MHIREITLYKDFVSTENSPWFENVIGDVTTIEQTRGGMSVSKYM